jgi:hypothetical protein
MRMNWNETFENFKRYTPDHPENVDFNDQFPTGGFVVYLPQVMLKHIIDENRISLDEDEILKDINDTKWAGIDLMVKNKEPLTPPWAKLNTNGKVSICQGCHRFQKAYLLGADPIPIVVNESDFETLKLNYGLHGDQLKP